MRAFLPNSIDPQLDPKELINRRISNHEGRIKNKNQNNKVFYKVGSRVRLQDVKSKLFSTLGTVLEQRTTDRHSELHHQNRPRACHNKAPHIYEAIRTRK